MEEQGNRLAEESGASCLCSGECRGLCCISEPPILHGAVLVAHR